MEEQKINNEFEINPKKNNIINSKNKNTLKVPKDIIIDLNDEIYNNIKCQQCNFIPLAPIVLTDYSLSKVSVLCRDCYLKSSSIKRNININNINKQYSLFLKSLIVKKKVKCLNYNLGCNFIGELSNLEEHLNEQCLYQKIKCSNKECNEILKRKELNYHLINCKFSNNIIKIKCNNCNKEFNFENISEHYNSCSESMIECDIGCGKIIKRKELEEHKTNICPKKLIKCKYWNKGCKKLIERKNIGDHYLLEKKNHLILEQIDNLNKCDNIYIGENFNFFSNLNDDTDENPFSKEKDKGKEELNFNKKNEKENHFFVLNSKKDGIDNDKEKEKEVLYNLMFKKNNHENNEENDNLLGISINLEEDEEQKEEERKSQKKENKKKFGEKENERKKRREENKDLFHKDNLLIKYEPDKEKDETNNLLIPGFYHSNNDENSEEGKDKNEKKDGKQIGNNNEINDNWVINQKKCDSNDNYIPFTSKKIKFITKIENINKNILNFETEKIKFNGKSTNYDPNENYYTLSEESLSLKAPSLFRFKIYSTDGENTPLPKIAFGLYKSNIIDDFKNNNIKFPGDNFFCIDLDSNTYKGKDIRENKKETDENGKKKDRFEKINTQGYITLIFYPEQNYFQIKDNFDLEIDFPFETSLENNLDIRYCFIFKGKERAIIEYNY